MMELGPLTGNDHVPLVISCLKGRVKAKYLPLAAILLFGLIRGESFTGKLTLRSLFIFVGQLSPHHLGGRVAQWF